MFNEGRYYERMREGEFRSRIVSETRIRRGDPNVRGARSQVIEYLDKFGKRIAIVHQYRKKDGTLGGSGRPDPKRLVHEDVLYYLDDREDWDLPEW